MTALLAESYRRAYVSFVTAQQLSELEEIVEYKQLLKQTGLGRTASVTSDKSLNDLDFTSNSTSLPLGTTQRSKGLLMIFLMTQI
jgi:hypothetical protein